MLASLCRRSIYTEFEFFRMSIRSRDSWESARGLESRGATLLPVVPGRGGSGSKMNLVVMAFTSGVTVRLMFVIPSSAHPRSSNNHPEPPPVQPAFGKKIP